LKLLRKPALRFEFSDKKEIVLIEVGSHRNCSHITSSMIWCGDYPRLTKLLRNIIIEFEFGTFSPKKLIRGIFFFPFFFLYKTPIPPLVLPIMTVRLYIIDTTPLPILFRITIKIFAKNSSNLNLFNPSLKKKLA